MKNQRFLIFSLANSSDSSTQQNQCLSRRRKNPGRPRKPKIEKSWERVLVRLSSIEKEKLKEFEEWILNPFGKCKAEGTTKISVMSIAYFYASIEYLGKYKNWSFAFDFLYFKFFKKSFILLEKLDESYFQSTRQITN